VIINKLELVHIFGILSLGASLITLLFVELDKKEEGED